MQRYDTQVERHLRIVPMQFLPSRAKSRNRCPLCDGAAGPFRQVEGVDFLECRSCDFIFADPVVLAQTDAGTALRDYNSGYWAEEMKAARQRSTGISLARVAEAVLYCRIPVRRFVDIGTGPGFLLDALDAYLPSHSDKFHGVEKFPPDVQFRSSHPNYIEGDLADCNMRFDCGVCIEVLEHLTPNMARELAEALAKASVPGSLYLFNTGLTEYVRKEDPGYLDPHRRGHITCWSVPAARRIFEPCGFTVSALRGKTWAFVIEFCAGASSPGIPMVDRIWKPVPENRALLTDPVMGEVIYLLGMETARAY